MSPGPVGTSARTATPVPLASLIVRFGMSFNIDKIDKLGQRSVRVIEFERRSLGCYDHSSAFLTFGISENELLGFDNSAFAGLAQYRAAAPRISAVIPTSQIVRFALSSFFSRN